MILSVANSSAPRNIESIKVSGLFPEALRESSSTLISFIERYYEHINTVGMPSYEISNITSDKDIDITSDKYLTSIQSLIARTIPNTPLIDKVTLYRIVLQYYNTRGSDDSIYAFFKLFYGEIVSIFYPRDYLFDLSSGSGQWGTSDNSNTNLCKTNPNKTTMVVSSNSSIGPRGELTVYLKYIGNNVWSYEGKDPESENIPFIQRYDNPYYDYDNTYGSGWIFTYDTLQNLTINDAPFPDEATWGIIEDALVYKDSIDDSRSIVYAKNGIPIDYSTKFVYQHTFSIHAESTPGSGYGDIIFDAVHNNLYTVISLNPTVWVLDNNKRRWKYTNHKSFASDNYKIHDGHYWQKYSYHIKSEQSSAIWLNDYLRFVHPAGLKLFTAVLLTILAETKWNDFIDYDLYKQNHDFLNVKLLRPPTIGYHTPTYQPGRIDLGATLYTVLSMALRDINIDPSLADMILLTLVILKESDNSRNSIVRSDYQSWSKYIDSTQLCAAYGNMTIGQAMEPYSNSNICKLSNISSYVTLKPAGYRLGSPYFVSKTPIVANHNITSSYEDGSIETDSVSLSLHWNYGQTLHQGTLSNLTGSTTLSPSFFTEYKSYTASTADETFTVTPTITDVGDTIQIIVNPLIYNGEPLIYDGAGSPLLYNSPIDPPSSTVTLSDGINLILIIVTSADTLVTTVYYITVTKTI